MTRTKQTMVKGKSDTVFIKNVCTYVCTLDFIIININVI